MQILLGYKYVSTVLIDCVLYWLKVSKGNKKFQQVKNDADKPGVVFEQYLIPQVYVHRSSVPVKIKQVAASSSSATWRLPFGG